MALYMRAVIGSWPNPPFADLVSFVGEQGDGLVVVSTDDAGWPDFQVHDADGATVLAADLTLGEDVREELSELVEFLDDHDGLPTARATVESHLASATAVVGLQILPSRYDESVGAANQVITFLERWPGVLTQVDSVGWYDGDQLILPERG
ncbi:hypothetical protein [Kribbella sp. NPDC051718]|uniref:hypothetical protein n=1 Tax=Kribbella sp. NPDC051718 TaxID=3155168 RepID=UPI00343B59F4